MRKLITVLTLSVILASCSNNSKKNTSSDSSQHQSDTVGVASKDPKVAGVVTQDSINWENVPDLKNIGKFPFFTAPEGLAISNETNGLSELFDYAKMENFTGSAVYTTKGKLGMLSFEGKGTDFNKQLFDDQTNAFIKKIAPQTIYEGKLPHNSGNEALEEKLKENLWNGKRRTMGFSDDEPIGVYAFKNEGKKYIVNIQSNSAQGKIFIMELK